MAALDDLINQIEDEVLRERIRAEVERANKQKKFGLVFEQHLPEATPLYDVPVKKGSVVSLKGKSITDLYLVEAIVDGDATCLQRSTKERVTLPMKDLVSVAQFGEPIYPYLQPVDSVCNAPDSDLWHTLIEADNYHALQLLEYLYAGKVDCIYIDPPYNTGASDWKYNNDYVDGNDNYRHSKWLSFMEKRLKIAKKLLNPKNSVLIITIDEKEYVHLGCLVEELFPEGDIEMVTSVINPRGKQRTGKFARTEEYIIFIKIGEAMVQQEDDPDYAGGDSVPWRTMRRSSLAGARGKHGAGACGPNQFFPVYVSDEGKIVDIGKSLPEDMDISDYPAPANTTAVFPLRDDGTEMNWGITDSLAVILWKKGYIRVGKHTNNKPQKWELSYLTSGKIEDIESGRAEIVGHNEDGSVQAVYVENKQKWPASVWMKPSHNAETEGTNILKSIFLTESRFTYPKSLYAVMDCINVITKNNKNALILDFFAGSGTTMHAVNLLNAMDGGHRRCVMVTNNEVSAAEAEMLSKRGLTPYDAEWMDLGIARHVTWPRVKCSIIGRDIKNQPLKDEYGVYEDRYESDNEERGKYVKKKSPIYPKLVGYKMADGFAANAAFFKLGFLDKTAVSLGRKFKEMMPLLWMKAGARGPCPVLEGDEVPPMMILPENQMAVLNEEWQYEEFASKVNADRSIKTVFLITDSETSYKEMAAGLRKKETHQLYREYLDSFRINQGGKRS